MTFEKYASIENSYREKFIEMIRGTEAAKDIWYISSKIHGSNFSIIYDGNEFKFASRSGILEQGVGFFGYQEVVKDKLEAVKIIYSILSVDKEPEELVIYGEIFGPGIQKGVNYGSKKDFRYFDIKVDGRWLDQDELDRFESDNFKMVPVLGKGTFEEVLNWNEIFDSVILGVPNNPEEGIVLKPNKTAFIDEDHRIILKKKHPKFSEIAHASNGPKEKKDSSVPQEFAKYITLNRLENVFSKIEPSFKNFNAIQTEFVRDIIEESLKDNPDSKYVDNGVEMIATDVAYIIKGECANLVRNEIKKRA